MGSSGPLIVTVNEQAVANDALVAGRADVPDAELLRFHLARGRNRILVQSRQGIGPWSFGVQVARSPTNPGHLAAAGTGRARVTADDLRRFAMAHEGDARRGEAIFFDPRGIGCGRCHSAGGRGTATIGPDLTGLALQYDRAELIRSVLEPSSRIADGYQPVVVATHDGRVLSGVVRAETDGAIELIDADAKIHSHPQAGHRRAQDGRGLDHAGPGRRDALPGRVRRPDQLPRQPQAVAEAVPARSRPARAVPNPVDRVCRERDRNSTGRPSRPIPRAKSRLGDRDECSFFDPKMGHSRSKRGFLEASFPTLMLC